MSTLIFIPAKKHSSRLKNKNYKTLKGKPLIYYTLKICRILNKNYPVFISTDSKKISNYSKKKFNFYSPYLRPKFLSKKNSSIEDGIMHGVKWYETFYKTKINNIILMQPTSPLRKISVVNKIINFYKKKKLESLATITQQKDNLIHHLRINPKNYKKWQLIVDKNKSKKKYYHFNGYLFIFSYKFLKKYNKVAINNKTYLYRTNKIESIDIDYLDDFLIAESLIK